MGDVAHGLTACPSALSEVARSRDVFAEAAGHAAVRVLDPVNAMRRHWSETHQPLCFQHDGHWYAAGRELVAKWLYEELHG